MKNDFSSILEDCLRRLQQGQSLDECLKLYPRHADSLLPLLHAAIKLHSVPKIQPGSEAVQAGRRRMLASVPRENKATWGKRKRWVVVFGLAVSLLAVIFISGFLTVNASADSLPDDFLYGVKRGWEAVRLNLSFTVGSHQRLETQFATERSDEIHKMIKQGRQGILLIEGVLQRIDGNLWTVSGLNVLVRPQTEIHGVVAVGARLTMQVQVYSDGQVFILTANIYQNVASTTIPKESIPPKATSTVVLTPKTEPVTTLTPLETQDPDDEMEPTDEQEPTDELEPTDILEPTDEGESIDD